MLSEKEFEIVYLRNLDIISKYLNPEMVKIMAVHDPSYAREGFDLVQYYKTEWKEFYQAYKVVYNSIGEYGSVCDCGGLLGVFALVLSDLGYEVSIVEALKYYDEIFDDLYEMLKERKVKIIDYDLFDTESVLDDTCGAFDLVSAMAIVEHYPYSLKRFMENLKRLCTGGGIFTFLRPILQHFIKGYFSFCVELLRMRQLKKYMFLKYRLRVIITK